MPRHNCASASAVESACYSHMAAVRKSMGKMMVWLSYCNDADFLLFMTDFEVEIRGSRRQRWPILVCTARAFLFLCVLYDLRWLVRGWMPDGRILRWNLLYDFSPKLLQGRRQASGLSSYPYIFLSAFPPSFKCGSCPFVIIRNIVW